MSYWPLANEPGSSILEKAPVSVPTFGRRLDLRSSMLERFPSHVDPHYSISPATWRPDLTSEMPNAARRTHCETPRLEPAPILGSFVQGERSPHVACLCMVVERRARSDRSATAARQLPVLPSHPASHPTAATRHRGATHSTFADKVLTTDTLLALPTFAPRRSRTRWWSSTKCLPRRDMRAAEG